MSGVTVAFARGGRFRTGRAGSGERPGDRNRCRNCGSVSRAVHRGGICSKVRIAKELPDGTGPVSRFTTASLVWGPVIIDHTSNPPPAEGVAAEPGHDQRLYGRLG